MIHIEDIYSLTEFQRNAKAYVKSLKETGRPQVLTVNGRAEVVVQDAKSYQQMMALIDRLQIDPSDLEEHIDDPVRVENKSNSVPGLI